MPPCASRCAAKPDARALPRPRAWTISPCACPRKGGGAGATTLGSGSPDASGTEVARRIAPLIPYEAYSFTTTDPDTGLVTHALAEGLPQGLANAYVGVVYPHEQAMILLDRARSGNTVAKPTSELFTSALREEGVEQELNTIVCAGGSLWGFLCLLRESHSVGYDEREMRFMRRIAPPSRSRAQNGGDHRCGRS